MRAVQPRCALAQAAIRSVPPRCVATRAAARAAAHAPAPATPGVAARRAAAAAAAALLLSATPLPAFALGPPSADPARCAASRLKEFAGVRASFSAEVGSGALPEAVLDLRECSFAGQELGNAVLAGAILDGADFSGAQLVHVDASRASAKRVNFQNAALADSNWFAVSFAGADLRGAKFTNALLGNATFGRDGKDGEWALLGGADFEGALLSRSDAARVCENPTVDDEGRAILGCR
jgi:hypothetical protein